MLAIVTNYVNLKIKKKLKCINVGLNIWSIETLSNHSLEKL